MRYVAKSNICVKGMFVREGEKFTLDEQEGALYVDADMAAFEDFQEEQEKDDQDREEQP
ncbi:hypothetical protein [Campylobacter hyointestinalis]|uniref:hypothetical protein n=1 Tax=Campylobacter hyointestinalis TaxID=198 RepID=UPI00072C0555|nr:hypothetical protein [Campylobacter hyointestinalis]MBT0611960.1 hypothetical protein [Campylobacter hyointestinalis subsp. hyointestinalis]MDY2999467.1 hypothetical protein [Campylobacter hyointestinalis]CUU82281.1 Uncharacterised protein [Campylobacter hyointestinalis subsp. hyointestinalis]